MPAVHVIPVLDVRIHLSHLRKTNRKHVRPSPGAWMHVMTYHVTRYKRPPLPFQPPLVTSGQYVCQAAGFDLLRIVLCQRYESFNCTLNVLCTLYSVYCTLYSVNYTTYSVSRV